MEKYPVFGVDYCATDYEEASAILIKEAKLRNSYTMSALAVHGLMEAYRDQNFLKKVSSIDMVVPDGVPVKWALNAFYNLDLKDRVCGPDLTLHVLQKANAERLRIYLYGSTRETLVKVQNYITGVFPEITVCGVHPDRFREATAEEDQEDVEKINKSEAHIVLVGRGCPRQERWVSDHKGKVHAVMMAVGAAFDFYAQNIQRAPRWMQRNGLEWLYRLYQDPERLWKRYFITNTAFLYLFAKHLIARRSLIRNFKYE